MTVGIGAGGFMGIALESTPNVYEAPTKFFPFENESLQFMQETVWRRPIRQSADIIGAVDGNVRTEGEIAMEAFEDVVPYFLYCGRTECVKTGGPTNYQYTFTPTDNAVPTYTMSITIVRNNQVFGYTGCVVSSYTFTIEDGQLKFNVNIIGSDEDSQSLPMPTYTTTQPFGAGRYSVQIPTSSQVFDADTFEFTCDDSGEAQYRLKDTGRGAQYIKFGERTVSVTTERDFENRADYEGFKLLTSQSISLLASKGADNQIQIVMPASIKDSYGLGLSGQGDLVRASITYNGVIDNTGNGYTITIRNQENIDPPTVS